MDLSSSNAQSIGRARFTDVCALQVEIATLRGSLSGYHIKSLTNVWNNHFGSSYCCVAPQDLNWVPVSGATGSWFSSNTKAAFLRFTKRNEPRLNDLEMLTTVRVTDVDVAISSTGGDADRPGESAVALTSSGLTLTYMLHPTCGDLTLTLHPSVLHFPASFAQKAPKAARGVAGPVPPGREMFIALGQVVYGSWTHYGPAPHYAAFHTCSDVALDSVAADITIEQVAVLAHLATSIQAQLLADDEQLTNAIRLASRVAAEDARQLALARGGRSGLALRRGGQQQQPSWPRHSQLSEEFQHELIVSFAAFLEEEQALIDQAADYGVSSFRGDISLLNVCISHPTTDYTVSLEAPRGLQTASSTINDTNSNKRTSTMIPQLTLRLLSPKTADMLAADIPGEYLEVGHMSTSLACRKYVAYPVEQGLVSHFQRQREFIARNDHAKLANIVFDGRGQGTAAAPPPGTPATVPPVVPMSSGSGLSQRQSSTTMQSSFPSWRRSVGTLRRVSSISKYSAFKGFQQPTGAAQDADEGSDVEMKNSRGERTITFVGGDDDEDERSKSSKAFFSCHSHPSSDGDDSELESQQDEEDAFGEGALQFERSLMFDSNANSNADMSTPQQAAGAPRPVLEFIRCLRPFDRHVDSIMSLQQFSPSARIEAANPQHRVRNMTHAFSHAPHVTFEQGSMDGQFYADDGHNADDAEEGASDEPNMNWARRAADNSRRSREGSTTTHTHVEFLKPTTAFVTIEAMSGITALALAFDASQNPLRGANEPVTAALDTAIPKPRASRSRNKTRAKSWYGSDVIHSLCLPFLDVTLLHRLPVDAESIDLATATNQKLPMAVYATHMSVRDLQVVSQETLPPTRIINDRQRRTTKRCAGVRLGTAALIAQVEYEPSTRDKKLTIVSDFIKHNPSSDTIALFALQESLLRVKIDESGGASAVRLNLGDVQVDVLRDAAPFAVNTLTLMIAALRHQSTPLHQKAAGSAGTSRRADNVTDVLEVTLRGQQATPAIDSDSSDDVDDAATSSSTAPASAAQPSGPTLLASHPALTTLQFLGSVDAVHVRLIDVVRGSRCLLVNVDSPSTIDVKRVSINVSGKFAPAAAANQAAPTPMRQKATPASPAAPPLGIASPTTTKAGSSAEYVFQAFAEVQYLLVELYPEVLHFLAVPIPPMPAAASPSTPTNASTSASVGFPIHGVVTGIVRNCDVVALRNPTNFAKVSSTEMTVFVNVYSAAVRSQDVAATDDVEKFELPPRLKKSLMRWAWRARQRAKRSPLAAAPAVSAQQNMTSSVSFFCSSLAAQYVADLSILEALNVALPTETMIIRDKKCAAAASLTFREVQAIVLIAFLRGDLQHVIQRNVQVHVSRVDLVVPYRPHAVQLLHPQVHDFGTRWLAEIQAFGQVMASRQPPPPTKSGGGGRCHQPRTAAPRPSSLMLACDVQCVNVGVGVMSDIEFRLAIPRIAVLVAQSDARFSVKTHVQPFSISSDTPAGLRLLALPNVYVMVAGDEAKTNASVMVDQIEGDVSPELLNHTLLTYERLASEVSALLQWYMDLDGDKQQPQIRNTGGAAPLSPGGSAATETVASPTSATIATPKKKFGLTCVVAGLRISYICTMSALRLTVKQITLKGESSPHKGLLWTNEFHNIRLSLCDKGDELPPGLAHPAGVTFDTPSQSPTNPSEATRAAARGPNEKRLSITIPPTTPGLREAADVSSRRSNRDHAAPVLGYVWGLLETSVVVRNTREPVTRLDERPLTSTSSVVTDLGLTTVLVSTQQVSLRRTLCVLRPGLPQHLQYMIDETNDHIRAVRNSAAAESRQLRVKLQRSRTFRRVVKRSSTMVNQIGASKRPQQSRRNSVAYPPQQEEEQLVATQTVYVVNVDVTQFVIPFGDAAFRNVLEERRDVYSCGKSEKHVHSLACLNRKKFVPLLALKMTISRMSGNVMVQSAIQLPSSTTAAESMATPPRSSSRMGGAGGRRKLSEIVKDLPEPPIVQTCHLSLHDVSVFFTDGTKLDSKTPPAALLATTRVLGGIGTLTDWSPLEFSRSSNKVLISSVDVPLQIRTEGDRTSYAAAVHISAPQAQVTARVLSMINDAASEMTNEVIPKRRQASTLPSGSATSVAPSPSRADAASLSDSQPSQSAGIPPRSSSVFDVTLKLEPGSITFLSTDISGPANQRAEAGLSAASSVGGTGGAASPKHRITRRALNVKRRSTIGSLDELDMGPGARSYVTSIAMILPLPSATCNVHATFNERIDDVLVVAHVFANTMELSPALAQLSREVQHWEKLHRTECADRAAHIYSTIKAIEDNDVAAARSAALPPPTPTAGSAPSATQSSARGAAALGVLDAALPLPKAFAAILSETRLQSALGKDAKPNSEPRRSRGHSSENHGPNDDAKEFQTTVLINLSGLKFVVGCGTVSATSVSLSLDDAAGGVSVQFHNSNMAYREQDLARRLAAAQLPTSNVPKLMLSDAGPGTMVLLVVQRLRLDCQTKLEVKCLEMFLPALHCLATRRVDGNNCRADAIAISIPGTGGMSSNESSISALPNSSRKDVQSPQFFGAQTGPAFGSTFPEMNVRVGYMQQLYTVLLLWNSHISESREATQDMFSASQVTPAKGSPPSSAAVSAEAGASNSSLVITVSAGRLCVKAELGSGNKHELNVGNAMACAELVVDGTTKAEHVSFGGSVGSLMIRSEGLLSGTCILDSGFALKACAIRTPKSGKKAGESDDFPQPARRRVTTAEQRTYRLTASMGDCRMQYRERQIREMLLLEISQLVINTMNEVPAGAGAEPGGLRDSAMLKIQAQRVAGGLIPETVNVVLGAISNLSENLDAQRKIARSRVPVAEGPASTAHTSPLKPPHEVQPMPVGTPTGAMLKTESVRSRPAPLEPILVDAAASSAAPSPVDKMRRYLKFMGSKLIRVPTGEVVIQLRDVSVMLGVLPLSGTFLLGSAGPSGSASDSAIVLALPEVEVNFAECLAQTQQGSQATSGDAAAAGSENSGLLIKRALSLRVVNAEMYRATSRKQVILSLRGRNVFELFTQQRLNNKEVGFVFSLKQSQPWSGSPKIADFEAITATIHAFTNPSNAEVLAAAVNRTSDTFGASSQKQASPGTDDHQGSPVGARGDERVFVPLKPSKFSPELRFGGDVSVNVETILGWLSIRQELVPQLFVVHIADPLEGLLNSCQVDI